MDEIKLVLFQKKYFLIFLTFFVFLAVALVFAWDLILYTNFTVRKDLWTGLNIVLIFITAFLGALNFTLSSYYLKGNKKTFGFFSFIPVFFTTACPTCLPILFSFWGTAAGLWFAYFVDFRMYLIFFSIIIMLISLWQIIIANKICPIVKK